jgi:hypothetical protein
MLVLAVLEVGPHHLQEQHGRRQLELPIGE